MNSDQGSTSSSQCAGKAEPAGHRRLAMWTRLDDLYDRGVDHQELAASVPSLSALYVPVRLFGEQATARLTS